VPYHRETPTSTIFVYSPLSRVDMTAAATPPRGGSILQQMFQRTASLAEKSIPSAKACAAAVSALLSAVLGKSQARH
jgi:hypothetical protein